MNFFWWILGYKTEDNNENAQNIAESKDESMVEETKSWSSIVKRGKPINVKNFDLFFKNYIDEALNKDELDILHDNIKVDDHPCVPYQHAKYNKFIEMVDNVKREKAENGDMILTAIDISAKKPVYTFCYKNFEHFYSQNEDNILSKDELKIVYDKIDGIDYSTDTLPSERFTDLKTAIEKITEKKQTTGKKLTNIMFLGITYADEDNPRNIYKYFYSE